MRRTRRVWLRMVAAMEVVAVGQCSERGVAARQEEAELRRHDDARMDG